MRTTWNQWIAGIGTAALSLAMAPGVVWAADYSAMPTDELMELRGTMRDAPAEEHERFRIELQNRIQQMTAEERAAYGLGPQAGTGPGALGAPGAMPRPGPGSGFGDGTRPRPMDGTGFGAGGRGGGGPRR
jgi:hypothetical protein